MFAFQLTYIITSEAMLVDLGWTMLLKVFCHLVFHLVVLGN